MRVKIPTIAAQPEPDYPLRVSSFFLSVLTHGLGIAALLFVSFPGGQPERPIYDEFIRPQEHKIVYYDFRKQVPDVAPVKQVGVGPQPRGAELSEQAIIATSPKPKSKQVFISVPAPDIEIHQDLPAPLLVARIETSLPPPPAPSEAEEICSAATAQPGAQTARSNPDSGSASPGYQLTAGRRTQPDSYANADARGVYGAAPKLACGSHREQGKC